ncbi:unnamed protein product [Clonostachys byssicola]|uniref:Uncharacterized protein n=1 Tax=Clonostachys byssicola TaxID=160290 RepID=A0A9N9Y5Z1_9HYPO|nr:unnamed protein product [Clonostachys byssicola]
MHDYLDLRTLKVVLLLLRQSITTVRYVISQKDDIEFSKDLAVKINGYITHVKSYNGYNTVYIMKTNIIAYSSIRINTCSYNGYSWSILINSFISFN